MGPRDSRDQLLSAIALKTKLPGNPDRTHPLNSSPSLFIGFLSEQLKLGTITNMSKAMVLGLFILSACATTGANHSSTNPDPSLMSPCLPYYLPPPTHPGPFFEARRFLSCSLLGLPAPLIMSMRSLPLPHTPSSLRRWGPPALWAKSLDGVGV